MIKIVPTPFDKLEYLTRQQCADFLKVQGLRMSDRHLANLASNNNAGGGPPFYRTRWKKVFYSRVEVSEWLTKETERVP